MSKKKSLGHNPLSQRGVRYATFDFIKPLETEEDDHPRKKRKINKTTASYYLEEPVVNKVRRLAKKKGTSYSALVNEMLKYSLAEI
ncbi:hypothetical protein [Gracilimonas mengyeensis]|uniref:Uncharacterized protein n=1 Tax=Gracilimonas mengyeensis TaxID=1302730 RepID=A0A521AG87_9BACT|nr:hypothetical protein [Gracilimonas mengyeensis]SMO33821.1 hypothetical protein SAMN06265219_101108 [Gracilimonas mengyeensis]